MEKINLPAAKHFINGEWVDSASGLTFLTYNPSTEEPLGYAARGGVADVEHAISAARRALAGPWGQMSPKKRGRFLYAVRQEILAREEELALLETLDNGKPLSLARREVRGAARYFEYYAGAADKIHGEQIPLGPSRLDFTMREPLGVTGHIIPWNKPLNILARSVAPALAAGNTAVVKPSEQTPLTALILADIFARLDCPPGVLNVVNGYGEEAGAALAGHTAIDHLTFTGSVPTGREVMKAAAEHIKPVLLELGGKSPLIIFSDADLETAVAEAMRGITVNCGQMCSAGSRLLVAEDIYQPFVEMLLTRIANLRIAPGIEDAEMGPLVSDLQFSRVNNHIEIALSEGAEMIYGGKRPIHLPRGFFMLPTLFTNVLPDMHIAQQEVFGPVLALTKFKDEEEALRLANGVPYGLMAGVFTQNIGCAMRMAAGLQAGQVYVNEYYAEDEEMPFGGYKQSGFGRAKGLEALHHYTQVKNVAVRIRP